MLSGDPRPQLFEAAAIFATIHLSPADVDHAMRETDMTMDTIAKFYEGTELGQTLIDQGRTGVLGAILQERFGDRPDITPLARRLAQRSDTDALHAIKAATSLEELLVAP